VSEQHPGSPILRPGRNCWRVEHAERIAFLVDGAAYFQALRAAAVRARRSIFIVGWDIDSRMRLVPEGAGDGLPEPLGGFLNALAKRSRGLHIHVLNWDFAMLYAVTRELLPGYRLGWRTHRRMKFALDGAHPVGASHHQKFVVIDDRLAFIGGFDLSDARWDTPEHRPDEPRRKNPGRDAYGPFHDIQVAVDGNAAIALGELARERWRRATGKLIARPQHGRDDPWPEGLAPDLHDALVGIARTEPAHESHAGVREIKQLYLDSIARARRLLYFENQFFTATSIADALAERLSAPDGPEAVLVSRDSEEGWLEETTMGVLRARVHRRLCDTASAERYGSFYPHIPGLGDGFLNVHSKLMSMDDELLTIGSANLSNRSMGLDTECNLVIEACGDERIRAAIRGLRHRLLAEHLDRPARDIAAQEQLSGSMLSAIRALCGTGRTLRSLEPEVSAELDASVPPSELLDPEQPVDPGRLVARMAPGELHASTIGRLAVLGAALALVVAGVALRALLRRRHADTA
jgi:phospholipase D1/2